VLTRSPSPFPMTVADEQRLDRRRFLSAAGAALTLAGLGNWLGRRLIAREPAPAPVPAAALADLAPGEARIVTRNDGETLAVRFGDGSIAAFDRRCPHLGCPVVWSAERGRFECPCHHAAFDARTGAVLFGPPDRGLTPTPIRA
jgi:arsenite oxidase small subunit